MLFGVRGTRPPPTSVGRRQPEIEVAEPAGAPRDRCYNVTRPSETRRSTRGTSYIDWGRPLELWESDEGELGHQYVTDVGRLDFLCRDTADDTLVVIELKRGRPSDRVVGQATRYMGWVRANLARPGQRVGLIVAHEQEDRLAYAVAAVPDLSVLTYQIDFRLSLPPRPGAIAS